MTFHATPGQPQTVAEGVVRLTAPNPGPFTFHGTNTYLVGDRSVAIIDPGPADERHLGAILDALGGRAVEAILVTHTHLDHTGLTDRLREATGAPVLAEGPHRAARALHEGEVNGLDAAGDKAFRPDRTLADGETIELCGLRFEVVATPGHTANHLSFALAGSDLLFSGDHVMAWSTTVVAPPDGSMASYMHSLERLMARPEKRYLPGHGGPVENAPPFLRALRSHRRMREAAILERLAAGDRAIGSIVASIYRSTDPRLHGAAALSVLAQLEDLVERGLVRTDGPPLLESRYERV
ncbi:MBL fold metallo-hydrolase [Aureimonas populi]|uniref:MBL fold metallo-hydrolase n=1 Tax=Aureimonas populi TaxID=1701758 RepID=A0ABW5CRF5_9HYPH|nr:MBL fold metallo-hydrolase [Aureimonas populi]